jgi:SAM-dependent methyltransferase
MKALSRPNSVATLLASLSDPARLRMARLLEQHELSVGEIAKVFQSAQSTASRQLKLLLEHGWIAKRHEGTATFYRLILDELSQESRTIWIALRTQLSGSVDVQEDDRRCAAVVEERKTDSVHFFGRVRGEWDQLRSELFGGRFTSAALLSLIRPDWVVADIGCGTGNVAELLSPVVERVVAVDQSEPMLSAARQRLEGRGNIEFVLGALPDIMIAPASVDAAVCMLVLHHVPDVQNALESLFRLLRTARGGGVLTIVDMVAHDREDYRRTMGHRHLGFSKDQMVTLLKGAGFSHTLYYDLPAEPEARGPGLFVATGRVPGPANAENRLT